MSLKALAHKAVERNRQRNQSATSQLRSATGSATRPLESQYLSGSQSCVFSFPRKRNRATGERQTQLAAQPMRNWQRADAIAADLISRLCVAWAWPPTEYAELLELHRAGRLSLEYIERLIQDAPPSLRRGRE